MHQLLWLGGWYYSCSTLTATSSTPASPAATEQWVIIKLFNSSNVLFPCSVRGNPWEIISHFPHCQDFPRFPQISHDFPDAALLDKTSKYCHNYTYHALFICYVQNFIQIRSFAWYQANLISSRVHTCTSPILLH